MADADLERRVEILEANMDQLRDVPARLAAVESQIVQLRGEMRGEFSAVRTELGESLRTEIDDMAGTLRTEMHDMAGTLRTEMRDMAETLRTEMRDTTETLRTEMRSLNDETCTQMRVLHEEVISRLSLLQESGATAPPIRGTRRVRKTKQ